MDILEQLIIATAFCSLLMMTVWIWQIYVKDASFVDVAWAGSIGCLAIFYLLAKPNRTYGDYGITLITCCWSFRLAGYLLLNRIIGKPEDSRYKHLRDTLGKRINFFLFWFFQLQALAAVLFSAAHLMAVNSQQQNTTLIILACAIGVISISGEAIADYQLAAFKKNPEHKGKVCQSGLWYYSRHPNYFFEWLHWWSYVIFCLGTPWWYLTIIQPVLMLIFLFRFTGIPATEEQSLRSKGDEYKKYQQTTSVFIPWFRKSP